VGGLTCNSWIIWLDGRIGNYYSSTLLQERGPFPGHWYHTARNKFSAYAPCRMPPSWNEEGTNKKIERVVSVRSHHGWSGG